MFYDNVEYRTSNKIMYLLFVFFIRFVWHFWLYTIIKLIDYKIFAFFSSESYLYYKTLRLNKQQDLETEIWEFLYHKHFYPISILSQSTNPLLMSTQILAFAHMYIKWFVSQCTFWLSPCLLPKEPMNLRKNANYSKLIAPDRLELKQKYLDSIPKQMIAW